LSNGPPAIAGQEWFATATALINAVNDGLENLISLPADQSDQITQSNWLPLALSKLHKFSTCLKFHPTISNPDIFNDIQKWQRNVIADAHHEMRPHIDAELDAWRSARLEKLKAIAQKDIDLEVASWSALSCRKHGLRDKSPHCPAPQPDSALGKRCLHDITDPDSDMDTSDEPPQASADLSRTPCAKWIALPKTAAMPQNPTLLSDPLIEKLSQVLGQ
jgi:hypothetical protein